jgi:16S rRNA (uracil1498-N3)-methyltransferase
MSIPRLHLDAPLAEGALVESAPGQAHHIGHVLRRGVGDAVLLFNAAHGAWQAEIAALRKDRGSFRVLGRVRAPAAEPGPMLLIAILKRDPMDWLVEKATELGASRILPVITQRTIAQATNTDRLRQIARAAAEQCERLTIPIIAEPAPLHRVLDGWDATPLLVAAERAGAAPFRDAAMIGAALPALLIGPEGGFTPPELDDLRRRPFVAPTTLGPRILRAETAAISALAALQALRGDWA